MPSEVLNYIKKAQIRRAPGREGITNKILRNLTLPVIFQITNIISNIFITGHFPDSWKHASVIPILKPKKPRSAADSYRPISLLPVLSKLAERLILSRLNDFLTTNKILISQQHGFKPQLSTSHQLLRVVEYAKSGFKEKKCTGAVFLDIQKAFDRVWHTGLLYKLIKINAPPQLILIIKSFLNNRFFAVRVNDTHSSTKQIRAGAPQGALLSPTLFNIYINDIPKTRQTTVCLYADDTAILTQSTNKNCITHFLHKHLAELEDWYKKWKISINPEKNEAVFFSLGTSTRKPLPIHVQNHPVPWSRSVNYLGVTLDEHLSFKDHIMKINNKFRALACLYYPYFTRNSPLSIKNRLLIYTSILRPVLLYASPVWGHATKSNINRLEFSQNIMIRKLTNSPWETCLPPRSQTNFFPTDSTPSSVAASPLVEHHHTVSTCLFADDSAALTQGVNLKYTIKTMQQFLVKLEKWLTDWRIAINVEKTQAIVFRKWGVIDPQTDLTLFDDNILWVPVVRYLGLYLDSRLTYKNHIDYLSDKHYSRILMLK
ncbi:RNA-directed DNA polymerase from mobile element jockey [Trichonephila clavipes]|nr:RNA-directed DNA polymerase from mobile element jockey [Trichonephila clavipes]